MEIDKNIRADALRYMGYRGKTCDEATAAVCDYCETALAEAAKPRYCAKIFEISRENGLFIGAAELRGKSIEKFLRDCQRAAVVCATISAETDRLIAKMSLKGAVYQLCCDALASALVERVSEAALREICEAEGVYSTKIFGAGYGDFPLDTLPELLNAADAERKIGLYSTAAGALVPTKSIVGVAGLGKQKELEFTEF